ncbi:unnamed protein product [Durusdinium trenchii]|uniref:Uncharacterized protein n=1 Tax=Durusdinium trenchii TaxID=1381693 RepID=A0ABP0SK21_9DINO
MPATWQDLQKLQVLQQSAVEADVTLAANAALRSAHWASAVFLLDSFATLALEVTQVVSGCALTAVARSLPHWATCLTLLQISLTRALASLISHNIVIAMCGKTLCWNRSLSLTASLTRSRLRPTASTIGGLLTAFERGGYWVAALSKLSLTREQPAWLYGAKGGEVSVTWNAGVAACASSAAWEWAAKLVRGEPWRGVSTKAVGTAGYNAAMAACGNWVVAMELLRQLLRSGSQADTASVCTTIGANLEELLVDFFFL